MSPPPLTLRNNQRFRDAPAMLAEMPKIYDMDLFQNFMNTSSLSGQSLLRNLGQASKLAQACAEQQRAPSCHIIFHLKLYRSWHTTHHCLLLSQN